MATKTFKTDLSVSGLNALKKQLLQYRDELPIKCKQLVSMLLKSGVEVAETNISESPLGKYVTVSTNISADKMGCNGILLAKGQVKEQDGYEPFSILLAIEFGAGVHFNPTPNPLISSEFPYGVGTFPGQTHAYQDMWYYWDENKQKWMPTHGVKATMPMYKASEEIRNNILKIAKDVFRE
nr:MAG TPA: hypothetical protein [Caudoviricetes sp.]